MHSINVQYLERLHGIILRNLEAVVWYHFCLDAQKRGSFCEEEKRLKQELQKNVGKQIVGFRDGCRIARLTSFNYSKTII